jgi:hypothetical protein
LIRVIGPQLDEDIQCLNCFAMADPPVHPKTCIPALFIAEIWDETIVVKFNGNVRQISISALSLAV